MQSTTCYKTNLSTLDSNSGCCKLLLADRIDFFNETEKRIFRNLIFWKFTNICAYVHVWLNRTNIKDTIRLMCSSANF